MRLSMKLMQFLGKTPDSTCDSQVVTGITSASVVETVETCVILIITYLSSKRRPHWPLRSELNHRIYSF